MCNNYITIKKIKLQIKQNGKFIKELEKYFKPKLT